jgi:CheY-like chemotaxis protein
MENNMEERYKILVVEPEESIRNALSRRFRDEGIDFVGVECAENDFLDKVVEWKPSLISLNVNLFKIVGDKMFSTMDGFEVLKSLKNDPRTADIPVVFLTNQSQRTDIDKGIKFGAIDYVILTETTPSGVVKIYKKHLSGEKPIAETYELSTKGGIHEGKVELDRDKDGFIMPSKRNADILNEVKRLCKNDVKKVKAMIGGEKILESLQRAQALDPRQPNIYYATREVAIERAHYSKWLDSLDKQYLEEKKEDIIPIKTWLQKLMQRFQ